MNKIEDYEVFIKKNFLPIWTNFLDLEIQRSLKFIKFMGSPNAYIIMQVIAWHQNLSVASEIKDADWEESRQKWFHDSKYGSSNKMKLSYTLVSELSGLSVETIRRHVKKMINDGWVSYNKKNGIQFRATEENFRNLADNLNIQEVKLLARFLAKVNQLKVSEKIAL